MQGDFEKLGAFYLGRGYDVERRRLRDDLVLYDSRDLVTHAVCLGMTGSGKTGLCLALLEEAAIDGIPAIVIDPKGDMANLLLGFPGLSAEEFLPWIDRDEASRHGVSPEEQAARTAQRWREGLADWGQDGDRIARMRQAVDFGLYTPGSTACRPLSLLRSMDAPPAAVLADGDALREKVQTAVAGLLALLDLDADPLTSRDHILLANLLDRAWREGRNLDLPALIREIQTPPFTRLGVIELDAFFPPKDRFALAMRLNNLLASPGFAAWLEGEPLDVAALLHTPEGKPRLSILSIAHLGDTERMFFVTTLLNEVVGWMRAQPGTSSLRAILYMDEVFGYLPPTAMPPSKKPLLTLLKQARAMGLGVVLATQNPVDLDYKALSNAGTWFLGRLQTERDRDRVLDGLEGAASAGGARFDRASLAKALGALDSRVFLLNNVHEQQPIVFHSRWALSYLAGPLTRVQLQQLDRTLPAPAAASSPEGPPVEGSPLARPVIEPSAPAPAAHPPLLSPEVGLRFLHPAPERLAGGGCLYRPALLAVAQLHFVLARARIDEWKKVTLLSVLTERSSEPDWSQASLLRTLPDLDDRPFPLASFAELPPAAAQPRSYKAWQASLGLHLYQTAAINHWTCPALGLGSGPGEREGEFRVRVAQALREQRDDALAKLRQRYSPRLQRLEQQLERARAKVEQEQSQFQQRSAQAAVDFGSTMVGAFLGRKIASSRTVGRFGSSLNSANRAAREHGDVERARTALDAALARLEELEQEFQASAEQQRLAAVEPELVKVPIRPRKSDLEVGLPLLVWVAVTTSGPR